MQQPDHSLEVNFLNFYSTEKNALKSPPMNVVSDNNENSSSHACIMKHCLLQIIIVQNNTFVKNFIIIFQHIFSNLFKSFLKFSWKCFIRSKKTCKKY